MLHTSQILRVWPLTAYDVTSELVKVETTQTSNLDQDGYSLRGIDRLANVLLRINGF